MKSCITTLISACLSIMLAKSVHSAEPFMKPWISAPKNDIATINHPSLLNTQTLVKKSLPQRILLDSSEFFASPFRGLTRFTSVNNDQRQTVSLTGNANGNLGLEFSMTSIAFTLITSVLSIIVMSIGAGLFPDTYKTAGLRVRTGKMF